MKKNKTLVLSIIFFIIFISLTLYLLSLSYQLLLFWALGLALGFILQRSNFCFAGGFLNFFLFNSRALIKAIIIALVVSSLGFGTYQYYFSHQLITGNIFPWGAFTVIGALLFGLGMSLAGACAINTLVRIGEGSMGFLLVFLGIILGTLLGDSHLSWWQQRFKFSAIFLPQYLGWGGTVLFYLAILLIILIYFKKTE